MTFKIPSFEDFEKHFDNKDILGHIKVDIIIDSFSFKALIE